MPETCPGCGGYALSIEPFDFGVCQETGYHDCGEKFQCLSCGAQGDRSDLGGQTIQAIGKTLDIMAALKAACDALKKPKGGNS